MLSHLKNIPPPLLSFHYLNHRRHYPPGFSPRIWITPECPPLMRIPRASGPRGASWRAKGLTERLKPSSLKGQDLILGIRRGEASVSLALILWGFPDTVPPPSLESLEDLRCDHEQVFHYPPAAASNSVTHKATPRHLGIVTACLDVLALLESLEITSALFSALISWGHTQEAFSAGWDNQWCIYAV